MRDELNQGGNLISTKEAARLKKRLGQEPGNKKRGIGTNHHDRTETNTGEFNSGEHSRMLGEIDRLKNKRLIKGTANKPRPAQTDFEREVEAYASVTQAP